MPDNPGLLDKEDGPLVPPTTSDGELEEYLLDMFKMVWRDAEHGRADRLSVVTSATSMSMKRINAALQHHIDAARIDELERLPATKAKTVHDAQFAGYIAKRKQALAKKGEQS